MSHGVGDADAVFVLQHPGVAQARAVDVAGGGGGGALVLPGHQVAAAVVGHRGRGLVRDGGADGDPRAVLDVAGGGHARAVNIPGRLGVAAIVLPDHQVVGAAEGRGRGRLVVGRHGDGDPRGVQQRAVGGQPGAVDVGVGGALAVVGPDHQKLPCPVSHRGPGLVPGGHADADAAGVLQHSGGGDPRAEDIGVGSLAMVLPDHQEVGRTEGHRGVVLVAGSGADGQALGLLKHPVWRDPRTVDVRVGGVVAVVLPDHQVGPLAMGHAGHLLVAGRRRDQESRAVLQHPRGADPRTVNVPRGGLEVAIVLPHHQIAGAVGGHRGPGLAGPGRTAERFVHAELGRDQRVQYGREGRASDQVGRQAQLQMPPSEAGGHGRILPAGVDPGGWTVDKTQAAARIDKVQTGPGGAQMAQAADPHAHGQALAGRGPARKTPGLLHPSFAVPQPLQDGAAP